MHMQMFLPKINTLFFFSSVDSTAKIELVTDQVSELKPFSLSCVALNQPTPQVSWLKDNALLISEELKRVSVNTTIIADYYTISVLTVEGAVPRIDDGFYQCRILSPIIVFDSITITVSGESLSMHIPVSLLHLFH